MKTYLAAVIVALAVLLLNEVFPLNAALLAGMVAVIFLLAIFWDKIMFKIGMRLWARDLYKVSCYHCGKDNYRPKGETYTCRGCKNEVNIDKARRIKLAKMAKEMATDNVV